MARTKKEIFFLVIGLLVSPFVFKGQCHDKVKEEEPEYIIFPKAIFSSNADNLKGFLSNNVLIDDVAEKTRTSSSEPPLSPSSDKSTTKFDVEGTTVEASSPGIPCESVTAHAASGIIQWHPWNNSYYAFVTSHSTWEDAMERCRCEGAHLVFIESDQENRWVSRLAVNVSGFQNVQWWIGLNESDEEGHWKWDGMPLNYTNWMTAEPNGGMGLQCGQFKEWKDDNALWNDAKCSDENKFICEIDQKEDAEITSD